MTKLVEKYLPVMKKFKKMSDEEKQMYLKDTAFAKCICEVCLNVIKGVVPIKKNHKQKLRRYSNTLRKLTRKIKKKNFINKKRILQSGGAFLPLLFSIVAPILTKLLTGGQ